MKQVANPAAELWRKMEAEGRLRCEGRHVDRVSPGTWIVTEFMALRLTDDERKRLLYPSVMSLTNLAILGGE